MHVPDAGTGTCPVGKQSRLTTRPWQRRTPPPPHPHHPTPTRSNTCSFLRSRFISATSLSRWAASWGMGERRQAGLAGERSGDREAGGPRTCTPGTVPSTTRLGSQTTRQAAHGPRTMSWDRSYLFQSSSHSSTPSAIFFRAVSISPCSFRCFAMVLRPHSTHAPPMQNLVSPPCVARGLHPSAYSVLNMPGQGRLARRFLLRDRMGDSRGGGSARPGKIWRSVLPHLL